MANEIVFKRDPGGSYFVVIKKLTNQQVFFPDNAGTGHDDTYGGSAALEAWGASSHTLADYGIEVTGDDGGLYVADFPSFLDEGVYIIEIYLQASSNPADSDGYDNAYELVWSGNSVYNPVILFQAATMRAGKAQQDKLSGIITYYDADGVTPLYTETETDNDDGTVTVEVAKVS